MVKLDRIEHTIELPEGVSVSLDGITLKVNGPNGNLEREYHSSNLKIMVESDKIIVQVDIPRRKDKALAGTWNAHINNMVKGVTSGFTYNLKALYSHFPMTLKQEGNELVVNNYFGERVPRRAKILPGVKVEIKNKVEIIVSGIDKELVGQTAANIERCATVKNRDRRVFQDGIYLLSKE